MNMGFGPVPEWVGEGEKGQRVRERNTREGKGERGTEVFRKDQMKPGEKIRVGRRSCLVPCHIYSKFELLISLCS